MQRNVLGQQLFNLTADDEVVEVAYTNEFEYCEFSVGLTAKNNFKVFAKAKKNDRLKVNTDNLSDLILFSNKGNVYKVKGFLLTKINEKEIPLTSLVDGFSKGERIIDIYSIKDFAMEKMLYFFTKKGMVKKTALSEYGGEYLVQQGYKFKYEKDEIVKVVINDDILSDVIIVTKGGMAIKFSSENVNSMGRIASGVTGISLRDGDEVISADVKENHEDLEVINNESMRISRLCENMLHMSRLDSQVIVSSVQKIRLDEQIRKCIILLSEKWSEKEIDFSINLEKVSIFSDADMLQQVWINLIDNAIKYSGDNCKIDIFVKRLNDKSVAVSISDNGIGIEEKKLHKIFDKFYQCEESHKKSGSGLGLSISKRIIELLNGTIECKSKKDFGTTMVVTLFI